MTSHSQTLRYRKGRVVSLDRGYPLVRCADGLSVTGTDVQEIRAQHSISLVKTATVRAAVGDYVELEFPPDQDTPLITAIAPRKTALVRRAMIESIHDGEGRFEEQVLATNMDIVFIVTALGKRALDLPYLERQLVMAHQSGADVALLLTKADQAKQRDQDVEQAQRAALGCKVIVTSAVTGEGFDAVISLLAGGKTGVLLGRSGVGKSTLINELLGEALLKTGTVRDKDRGGRHITVARRLITLPKGEALIDTPGLRTLGLYDAYDGLELTFSDITERAQSCHYRDCTHTSEPDCAVKEAVENGTLEKRRLESYHAIYREVVD